MKIKVKYLYILVIFILINNNAFSILNVKNINIVSKEEIQDNIEKSKGIEHVHYIVKEGDTLASISEKFFGYTDWPAIYNINKDIIGNDPSLIIPGQYLKIYINK
jgi:nucleoid-associated protein YgaU